MKIAFVTNTCWNVYNFREGLVKHFLDRGDEVLSLAPRDEYTEKIEKWGVKHFEILLDQTGKNLIKDFKYLHEIRRIFKTEKPDVALCFTIKSNIYGSVAGKIAKVPTICNVSGLGTAFLVEGPLVKFVMLLYRFAFRRSSFIFFQNVDDRDMFLSFIKLSQTTIGVLPGSGINLNTFTSSKHTISTPTKFLMIARIIQEKGVREYAEATKILRNQNADAEFTLAGDLDENHARSILKSELTRIVEYGKIKYVQHSNRVKDLIKNHEVVVLPSYREGLSRTLLEGAAMGKALLASNVPGCKEVVIDGFNGFLFDVKNAKSLASKMSLYMTLSKNEKRLLGENSRKLAEKKFDERFVIEEYVKTVAQIVDK